MAISREQAERHARHFVLKEIGAGALGSSALLYLAAAGVGEIGICDGDRVELSNLSCQIIHRQKNLGALKTESAKRALLELNPDVTVQTIRERVTPDNIESAIAPYDFILDCTDRFETKFLINDACVLMGKPYSHAGAVRFEGQAMTYVPERSLSSFPPKQAALQSVEQKRYDYNNDPYDQKSDNGSGIVTEVGILLHIISESVSRADHFGGRQKYNRLLHL